MSGFEGTLFAGTQAASVPVQVEPDGTDIVIHDTTGARRIGLADIVADAPVPGVPRLLRLPGGELIETGAHSAVEALWPTQSTINRTAFALESNWWTVITAIGLVAVSAWLVIEFVLPYAAKPVAERISPRIERAMGERALATLDRTVFHPSALSDDKQAQLHEKFTRLVAGEQGANGLDLRFRKAGVPNAMALPGGIIVVTDEMVETVANDAEFAAVVAHEIGHERGHHSVRLVLQASGLAVLMTAIAGDAVGLTVLVATIPAALLQAHYSRQFETEADDYALALLKRHGQPPQAFADLLRRMQRQVPNVASSGPLLQYLSTHPATEERIERAEQAR